MLTLTKKEVTMTDFRRDFSKVNDERVDEAIVDYGVLAEETGYGVASLRNLKNQGKLPVPDGTVGGHPWWYWESIRATAHDLKARHDKLGGGANE